MFCREFLEKIKERKKDNENENIKSYISGIDKELSNYMAQDRVRTKKGSIKKEIEKTSEDNSTSSSNESDDSGKQQSRKNNCSGRKKTEESELCRLLGKLDSRKVPHLHDFDEESLMSLHKYLEQFEEHYKESFRGKGNFK